MPLVTKFLGRYVYGWHRTLGLLIAIPVILWSVSGALYPIASAITPRIRKDWVNSIIIQEARLPITVRQALQQNNITALHGFRVVSLNRQLYYQVEKKALETPIYLNCTTGEALPNGDAQYALWVALEMLGDAALTNTITNQGLENAINNGNGVKQISRITSFNNAYKKSNKILPVYQIAFDRKDAICLYIDPITSKLAAVSNRSSEAFGQFFAIFHQWTFIQDYSLRLWVLGCFALLAFASGVIGLYIMWITRIKKSHPEIPRQPIRKWHRRLGNVFFLTSILFAFSGVYHIAIQFLPAFNEQVYFDNSQFTTDELPPDFTRFFHKISPQEKLVGLSSAKFNNNLYLRASLLDKANQMTVRHINAADFDVENNGDMKYATYLANIYSENNGSEFAKCYYLLKYDDEYVATNKRLPIVKVAYEKNNHERFFIDPATGRLVSRIVDGDIWERYSFAFFHKHYFWGKILGQESAKTLGGITTVISAIGFIFLTIAGLILFVKRRLD